jgi:hypothetical protein
MRMRFARGLSIAIAMGLVFSGSVALAAGSSPAVNLKWKSGAASPFAGTRFDGAVVDKKVYFLGFRAGDDSTDGSVWYYDIAAKTYTDTGVDMPIPVSNYSAAVLKDKTGLGIYTFGGRDANGAIITNVQAYYPDTNTAVQVKGDPWPGTTPSGCVSLPAMGVAVVDNTAYVLGGASFTTSVPPCAADDNSKETWSFNPKAAKGSKWTKEPNLKVARGYITTAVDGNRIYAIGGDVNDAGSLIPQATVESWKVGAAKWNDTNYADLPEGCDESQAFAFGSGPLGGTITLAGCGQWPNALPDVLQYKISADSWSIIGALNEARRNQAGANIGSDTKPKLMVLGGYDATAGTVLQSSEVGSPASFSTGGTRAPQAQRPATAGKVSAF